jgi:glycosyltransferase involved in cell wall biosynthesis
VVRELQNSFSGLRYFRQEKAMGIDRDFATAVELARGEYCWLFSDDDLLNPHAIQIVLDAIKVGYALIIVNSEVRNSDLSKVLQARRLPFPENRTYAASQNDRLLSENGDYLSFIGGVVIRREVWNSRRKDEYFGTYFIHIGVIFQRELPGDTLSIAQPLVSIRYANASWRGKFFEIWMLLWPGIIWSFVNFADSVKSNVCPKEPWRSPATLLHCRARGIYSKKEYAELLKPRLASKWARAMSKACAYFPGRLANLLGFIYYSVSRRRSARLLILLDLANSPFCFWKLPFRTSES